MAVAWGAPATYWRDSHAQRQVSREEQWRAQQDAMRRYLSSREWFAKRDRAFILWRCLGWGLCLGLLVARLESSHLFGGARVLLLAPVQILAVFALTYATTFRLVATALHYRMKRVGHHLGYTHVDTKNEVYTERWYEIVPVTERVNKMEWRLRRGKPSPGFGPYLRRTIIAIALCRFWWVAVVFGTAWWRFGLSNVVAWLGLIGHRI